MYQRNKVYEPPDAVERQKLVFAEPHVSGLGAGGN